LIYRNIGLFANEGNKMYLFPIINIMLNRNMLNLPPPLSYNNTYQNLIRPNLYYQDKKTKIICRLKKDKFN